MQKEKQIAYKVSFISIIINVILTVFKIIAGVIGRSSAMLSDAVHSLSDVISTIVVIIGVKLSYKEADAEHPYGHEKLECVAAILLATILFIVGFSIGYQGIIDIINKNYNVVIPGFLALIAAILSIIIKEAMYWYTRYYAKKINSGALMADAWHHRSDALSSIGSFIGIGASILGYPIFDSIAAIVICLFILKAAYDIFKDAINKMIDKSCDADTIKKMQELIIEDESVLSVDCLMTRLFGNKIYVDVEISADGNITLQQAHDIAHEVHDKIEHEFPDVKHCMVHVNDFFVYFYSF